MKKIRVDHVDIAKGITIILVALVHSRLKYVAPDVVNSMGLFRMPLFFFLSGVFFSASARFDAFLLTKADELLKPYFSTLLGLFVVSVFNNDENLIWRLKWILYGNGANIEWPALWFLTHLFAVYCFAYFIFRFTGIQDRRLAVKYILIAVMLAIGSQWIDAFWNVKIMLFGKIMNLPGLPFSCDLVFISAAFFISGAFLKEWIVNFTPNSYVFYTSILIFIVIAALTDAHINLNEREFINPLFATIGAVCGIYFVISISVYFSRIRLLRNVFLEYGRASLFILIFHMFIGRIVYKVLVEFGMFGPTNFIILLLAFYASITIPIIIKSVITRSEVLSLFYFPLKST